MSATGEVQGPRHPQLAVVSLAAGPTGVVLVGTQRQAWLDALTDPAEFAHELAGHTDNVHAVALSSDGRWAATRTGTGDHRRDPVNAVFVWRLRQGRVDGPAVKVETGLRGSALAFVPGRDELLVGTAIGDLLRVGLDGEERGSLIAPDTNAGDPALLPHAHRGFVASIAVSADGRRAWTVSSKRINEPLDRSELRAWDLETGADRAEVVSRETAFRAVAISPDGAWLVTTSDGAPAEVWPAN